MKTIDVVIETLTKDFNCPKYLMDRIIYVIDDLEHYNESWEVKKIKGGYNLSSNSSSFDYLYKSFINH